MEIQQQIKQSCSKWHVLTNAVNYKQMELQFNQMYQPVQFHFWLSIASLCNSIVSQKQLLKGTNYVNVSGIYDLSLACASNLISVEEMLIQDVIVPQQACLYIVNDYKQGAQLIAKTNKDLLPYFLSQKTHLKNHKINIECDLPKGKFFFFILFRNQKQISKVQGFDHFESKFIQNLENVKLAEKLFQQKSSNTIFLNKIIEKFLLPREKVCIFYENPSPSCLVNISNIRQILKKEYYFIPSVFYQQSQNFYRLKFHSKVRQHHQFCIDGTVSLPDQVHKINNFISEKNKLIPLLKDASQKLKKMHIIFFKKHQNKFPHLLQQLLPLSGIKFSILTNLQNLVQTHKITVVVGGVSFAEMSSLQKFYNIFLVPLEQNPKVEVCFQCQIDECKSFISTVQTSFKKVYQEPLECISFTKVHTLYTDEKQLAPLMQGLDVPEGMLQVHYLGGFHSALADFQQYCRHIVLVSMESFTEEIETMIHHFLWKCNTLQIQLYVRYGQDFILRDRTGNYKFVKSLELNNKIVDYAKMQSQERVRTLPEPIFHDLEEIQQHIGSSGKLDDLKVEESLVSQYDENKKDKVFGINDNKRNQNSKEQNGENSFINILNESLTKSVHNPKQNQYFPEKIQKKKFNQKLGVLGEETLAIIGQFSSKIDQNDRKQGKRNHRIKQTNLQMAKLNQIGSPKTKSKEKASEIKPVTSRKSLQIAVKQNGELGETYKLFIFVHRSVPHHSLLRRSQKQYHILLYTRMEQILVFSKYLKPSQKIIVLCNAQSEVIYKQLVSKSKIQSNKLQMIFSRDLSQGWIRRQVDQLLAQQGMHIDKTGLNKNQKSLYRSTFSNNQTQSPAFGDNGKKFNVLVVYSSHNQRVCKSIKIIKKVFGAQLKIFFLRDNEFDQIQSSKFALKIIKGVKVYKIGLSPQKNQIQLTSIRSLFILAMHPDLKNFNFQMENLSFGIDSYIGRLIYGNLQKDYITRGFGKNSRTNSLRKNTELMKSQSNLFSKQESRLSFTRTDHSERKRSQSIRRSNISRSSTTLFKHSTKIGLIVSSALKQFYSSKTYFINEENLYLELLKVHSLSKMAIVLLTERQFDMYDLFQNKNYEKLSREIVWIVQTKTEGKQYFVGPQMVYSTSDNLSQAVECIFDQYERQTYFEGLIVQSSISGISNGKYGHCESNSSFLKITVVPNLKQALSSKKESKNQVILSLGQSKIHKKLSPNVHILPNTETMMTLMDALISRFQSKSNIEGYKNYGSLLMVPKPYLQKVMRSCEIHQIKNVLFEPYEPQNLDILCPYELLRILIIIDTESEIKALNKLSCILPLQKNYQQMGKKLLSYLL